MKAEMSPQARPARTQKQRSDETTIVVLEATLDEIL